MGGKNAKQKAQTGTCGYWPYANLFSCGFPNFFNAPFGNCFNSFSPFCGLNSFNNLYGCGFDGFNCYNGISPLALPFGSPSAPFCQPNTSGKLAMTYNGSKFNLTW